MKEYKEKEAAESLKEMEFDTGRSKSNLMMKKIIIIIGLIIFLMLLIIADYIRPIFYYNDIKNEYWNIKGELNEVYEYLINVEDVYVYIKEDYIVENDVNSTINSRETSHVLGSESGKKLFDLGYYEISKEENEVRFYKYRDIHGTYGISKTNININDDNVVLKKIDNDWCFFENE